MISKKNVVMLCIPITVINCTDVARLQPLKAKFHYAVLFADRSKTGRRQVPGWSQAFSELQFGLSSSWLAAS